MAKSRQRNNAIKLRQKGESIKEIAKKIKVSKGSVSIWCRDIKLTSGQIEKLQRRIAMKGSYKNRLRGARVQHERRLQQINLLEKKGFKLINKLSRKEILLIGTALYWGEGMKKAGRARIINSDPEMLKFIINWFHFIWGIPKNQLTLQILINKIHKIRIKQVEKFWSRTLRIPHSQFTKTTFIKRKNRKKYKNFPNHYGTITITVRRGGDLRYMINGLIMGIIGKSVFNKKPG